ncbi:MAG: phage baseplate assembly protein V, partial [Bacteroidota bacterium]
FEAELDANHQLPEVVASGWDYATGNFQSDTSSEPSLNKQGNLSGKKLAQVLKAKGEEIPFTTPIPKDELKALANGVLLRSRLAALRGKVSFFGNATPKLNTLIELKGFGDRFDGVALISSIKHTLRDGAWRTETGFGLPRTLLAEKHPTTNSNMGLLSSIRGLQNGVVVKTDEDPEKKARIQVDIPVLSAKVWARHSSFYATSDNGALFRPEIGDEVIVGFLNDDPRFPIILGSVYGPKHQPPYAADKKNSIKAIITKNNLKIELNDEDKGMTIATPAGNTLILSDKGKSITLIDQHKNLVMMDSDGITLKSNKDLTLDAKGNISLNARQNVKVAASGGDVSLKGNRVLGDGQTGVRMKGGATAELSAGGQTTVKGAMVMIN